MSIADNSDCGLNDYVISKDTARAIKVAQQLRAGNIAVNTARQHHETPFGGFKMSGVGHDQGDLGLQAYTELQGMIWAS